MGNNPIQLIHKSNMNLVMNVGNIPMGQSVTKMYFMVKSNGDDDDSLSLISLTAGLLDNSMPGKVIATFSFSPTDADSLLVGKRYPWFSKVVLSGGGSYSDPSLRDTLTVLSAGVKATS